ncbi:sensor histidine kinase [Actinoplanes derwentensis]|uniref:sensor histidine kinase n=1 Tax=Actinoplanes derwentensis TaxID=113562 RepID=UPI0015600363|nr:PAS domain-containing sensor histidine kinase [Actinoplanes derwentensis]
MSGSDRATSGVSHAAAGIPGLADGAVAELATDQRLLRRSVWLVRAVAAGTMFLGALVLAGWALRVDALMRVVPGASSMKPMTAVSLTILGFGLAAAGSRWRGLRLAGLLGCSAAAAIGVLVLVQYATGVDLGVDRLLFPSMIAGDWIATSHPGRMAPNTAAATVLLAAAQILTGTVTTRRRIAGLGAQSLCAVAAALAMIGLYSYGLGVSPLQRFLGLTGMAVHTAAAVFMLSVATFLLRPLHGPARLMVTRGPAAMLTRALLATAISVPPLLGWVRLHAQYRLGLFDTRLGIALLVIGNVIVLAMITLVAGARAAQLEAERDHSEILLSRHAQLQAVMDNMPAAAFLKDAGGRYIMVNEHFDTHFGAGRGTAVGLTDHDLFDSDTASHLDQRLQQALTDGATVRFEHVIALSGEPHTYLSALLALRQVAGQAYAVAGVSTDITDRKKAETKLTETAEALRSELVHRETIEAELRARQADLKAFAYGVAHDLKGPLASISGFAEIIGTDLADGVTDPGELTPSLERIRQGVDRMQRFIDDLLAYATARDATLNLEPVDLQPLVEQIVAERTDHLRTNHTGENPARFPDIYTRQLPTVYADRLLCRQLLDNLIGNALKYTAPGQPAHVEISAQAGPPGWAGITVADRGIGIPAEQHQQIFHTFHRATNGSSYQGTGLGLAICQRVVDRHHGTITVTDNPGGGSRFTATLPLRPPTPNDDRTDPDPTKDTDITPASALG